MLSDGFAPTKMIFVKLAIGCAVASCAFQGANAQDPSATTPGPRTRIRRIILSTRHLGAHGMGYNSRSLEELSRKLTPADIPTLIGLVGDTKMMVGAEFALASQCGAAIEPVRKAAVERKMGFLEAEEVMDLIAGFSRCRPEIQQRASSSRDELKRLGEEEQKKLEAEAEERSREDARIQKNALKMTDPQQARTLTRREREEVYRRSLKAMGLTEGGPMTPDQKKLVDQMYRTMVLGESQKTK